MIHFILKFIFLFILGLSSNAFAHGTDVLTPELSQEDLTRSISSQDELHSVEKINEDFLRYRMAKNRQNAPSTILHMFNYRFVDIITHLEKIKEMGFDAILISPPQISIDAVIEKYADKWWARYQPICYAIGGRLGNEAELRELTKRAAELGIKIIADVVLNHMADPDRLDLKGGALYYPPENLRKECGLAENENLFTEDDFNPRVPIRHYEDHVEVINHWIIDEARSVGLADLNQKSPRVLKKQKEYLSKLVDIGIKGFRLDAVKHMPPDYFNKLLEDEKFENIYVYGEVIAHDWGEIYFYDPYIKKTFLDLLDFTHLKKMKEVFDRDEKLGHFMYPNDSLLKQEIDRWVIAKTTHDVANNEVFRKMVMDSPEEKDSPDEKLADTYQLGRVSGIVLITSEDPSVAENRKQEGSDPYGDRWQLFENQRSAEAREKLKKKIEFRRNFNKSHKQEAVLPLKPNAELCVSAFTRGNTGLVVINKCGADLKPEVTIPSGQLLPGKYQDVLDPKKTFEVNKRRKITNVSTYPRSGEMYLLIPKPDEKENVGVLSTPKRSSLELAMGMHHPAGDSSLPSNSSQPSYSPNSPHSSRSSNSPHSLHSPRAFVSDDTDDSEGREEDISPSHLPLGGRSLPGQSAREGVRVSLSVLPSRVISLYIGSPEIPSDDWMDPLLCPADVPTLYFVQMRSNGHVRYLASADSFPSNISGNGSINSPTLWRILNRRSAVNPALEEMRRLHLGSGRGTPLSSFFEVLNDPNYSGYSGYSRSAPSSPTQLTSPLFVSSPVPSLPVSPGMRPPLRDDPEAWYALRSLQHEERLGIGSLPFTFPNSVVFLPNLGREYYAAILVRDGVVRRENVFELQHRPRTSSVVRSVSENGSNGNGRSGGGSSSNSNNPPPGRKDGPTGGSSSTTASSSAEGTTTVAESGDSQQRGGASFAPLMEDQQQTYQFDDAIMAWGRVCEMATYHAAEIVRYTTMVAFLYYFGGQNNRVNLLTLFDQMFRSQALATLCWPPQPL